jgi:hypothetical protein
LDNLMLRVRSISNQKQGDDYVLQIKIDRSEKIDVTLPGPALRDFLKRAITLATPMKPRSFSQTEGSEYLL